MPTYKLPLKLTLLVLILTLTQSCSFLPTKETATTDVNDGCAVYQPIYASNSQEAAAIPPNIKTKIEEHNKIWEANCLH